MKKTNLILFAVLAILGSFYAWYYVFKSNDATSLEGYDFNFAVKDTANIGKILIADRQGKTAVLTRISTNEWQINGKYKAMTNAVNNLLDVVARIDLMYRLPRNAVKPVVQDMASSSTLVKIFDKKGENIRSYYVGGVDMDGRGTFLMMEDANEPYATHIPNFQGSPAVRYFTEELDWRDRYVFSNTIEDIQEVSVDYPLQKSKSFKVKRESGKFNVEPFYPVTPRVPTPVNQGLVAAYLVRFRALGSEGFENDYPKKDSVQAVTPFAIVSLTDKNGKIKTVAFHPMPKIDANGNVAKNKETGEVLLERYFAETNEGDFLVVQHQIFGEIFWAYEGFFGTTKRQ